MTTHLLDINKILELQQNDTILWHQEACEVKTSGFYSLVEHNHVNNFQLWHEEDKARRDDCGFEFVYRAKRNIDRFNQQRNNYMEAMDEWIFRHYQPVQENCDFHSETPGMMIDRLSILALKAYHMNEQIMRDDVSKTHQETCKKKLTIITQQQQHLSAALFNFLKDIAEGKRSFHLYHQFKMYNDPNLNPELYVSKKTANQS